MISVSHVLVDNSKHYSKHIYIYINAGKWIHGFDSSCRVLVPSQQSMNFLLLQTLAGADVNVINKLLAAGGGGIVGDGAISNWVFLTIGSHQKWVDD